MPCTEASLSDKFCLDPILFTESTNSDDIPSMKSPEGHHRRSVLGKLSGWWKKKSSYYVDIHHDLQQDNTIFPDEESMGLSENEIFDTTSLTPPKVANAESNLMSTRNLGTSPRKHSSVVKSTLNLHSPKTPTNSVCSPPRALRLHVLPTLSESRSGESHPHENRMTTPRTSNRQPPSQYTSSLFSSPVISKSNKFSDGGTAWNMTPPIPERSQLKIPLTRNTSFSTDSLLSIDSLTNSYSENDDDAEDRYLPRTDFLDEHVTFLRMQTEPRSVQVAWDEG